MVGADAFMPLAAAPKSSTAMLRKPWLGCHHLLNSSQNNLFVTK
jgi:hypothetical protein